MDRWRELEDDASRATIILQARDGRRAAVLGISTVSQASDVGSDPIVVLHEWNRPRQEV